MNALRARLDSPAYQLFMLVLCLYALGVLAVQTAVRLDPAVKGVLEYADYAVCAIFFADFVGSLFLAKNRIRYLATWGWIDLVSSIPAIDVVRWGRAARVVRVFRVLRGLRATKIMAGLVLRRRAENAFLAVVLVGLMLVTFCSVAVLHFESGPESNIRTAEDAVWWAVTTITTVGYGDRYPVTSEGRFVAAILMCAGVALFGTFSGFLAAWFIGGSREGGNPQNGEILEVRKELAAVRELLEHISAERPRT